LLLEGKENQSLQLCKSEIVRQLEEWARDARPDDNQYAKYTVV
jgi:hypothetical protein